MTYPVQLAVDLLDRLTLDNTAERADLVRGTLALALALAVEPSDEDALGVLGDLERLILGQGATFSAESLQRMLRVVAGLRPAVGVH